MGDDTRVILQWRGRRARPTDPMSARRRTRPRHRLVLIMLSAALAASAAIASGAPAGAQDPAEIGELELLRDDLTNELSRLDRELAIAEDGLTSLEAKRIRDWAAIELLADEFERAVDSRREPAATRVELAVIGFTEGDPRQTALLDEIRALQGSDEPSRRRELYSAAIEDAQARLDAADMRLVELSGELAASRDQLSSTDADIVAATAHRDELRLLRATAALEVEEVIARLDLLRSLENKALLTGLTIYEDIRRPVLAVKIDNVSAARPQTGINQADIVYVEEVEAGLTRMAAIFHSTVIDEVGPVRSVRTGDFDLLAQFNSPLFSNSGGNRYTTQALTQSTLVDIGHPQHGSLYYRVSGRPAPHNLFTNPANLWSVGSGEKYETGSPLPILRFRTPDEPIGGIEGTASSVTIDYGRALVEYEWNGSSYDRTQDGTPMLDSAGVQVSPTTVIIHFTSYTQSAADALSPEAITVGQGKAWILSEGKLVDAVWRRESATDQTEYVDGQGNPIRVLPGRTWIEMPRTGAAETN